MSWFELQDVVTQPAGFDWSQFAGTTGPLVTAAMIVGYLAKLFIDARREKREDKKADLEGEVGAVAAAREAVALVREQMAELRSEVAALTARREEDSKKIDKLEQRVRELESENEYLKGHRGTPGRPTDNTS